MSFFSLKGGLPYLTPIHALIIYCCFSLFLVAPLSSWADDAPGFNSLFNDGLEATYQFKFQTADSIITTMQQQYPDQCRTYMLDANYHWWLLLSGKDNPQRLKKLKNQLNKALKILSQKQLSQLDYPNLYNYIIAHALKARLKIYQKEYMESLWYLDDCIEYIERSFDNEKDYAPFYLTSGLYKYLIAYTRHNYSYLYPALMFYPAGDTDKGLQLLREATRISQLHVNIEAHYFLMKIHFELEDNHHRAHQHARYLTDRYEDNLLYCYYYYNVLKEMNQDKAAHKMAEHIKSSARQNDQLQPEQKHHFMQLVKE